MQSENALAQCATTGTNPVTLTCANTTTTQTSNTASPNPATSDQTQDLNASIIGQVNTGATINGFGLIIISTLPGSTISMTNNGTISTAQGAGNRALQMAPGAAGNFGTFSYTGTGNLTNTGGGDALSISNSGTGNISINISGTSTVSALNSGNGIATGGVTGTVDVTVQAGGTVQGGTAVSFGGTTTANTLTNFGTVQGIGSLSSGVSATIATINNSGLIAGLGSGVFGGDLTITNNTGHTIQATDVGGVAVHAQGGPGFANVTNNAGATISATNINGIGVATTTAIVNNFGAITGALDGVNTQNTTTLTNSGTITGAGRSGVRVGSNASIDNSGTITGLTGIVFRDALAGFRRAGEWKRLQFRDHHRNRRHRHQLRSDRGRRSGHPHDRADQHHQRQRARHRSRYLSARQHGYRHVQRERYWSGPAISGLHDLQQDRNLDLDADRGGRTELDHQPGHLDR